MGREHERRRKAAAQKIIFILLWIGYADCHAVKYFSLFPSMMDRTQQVRFDQFSDQLKEDNVDEVYVTTNNEDRLYAEK